MIRQTNGRTNGWTNGRTNKQSDGGTNGRMNGQLDGRTESWTNGEMGGWARALIDVLAKSEQHLWKVRKIHASTNCLANISMNVSHFPQMLF